jgi:hypothetical protein
LKYVAGRCISALYKNANASTLPPLLESTFKYLDSENYWDISGLELVMMAVDNTASQYLFVIINMILDKQRFETRIHIKSTLISIIKKLISQRKLFGLTVPELLDLFVENLKFCLESDIIKNIRDGFEAVVLSAIGTRVLIRDFCGIPCIPKSNYGFYIISC